MGHDIGTYFNVFVPEGRAINPLTGTDWEGKGVLPDVRVPAQDALEAARKAAAAQAGHALRSERSSA